MYPGWFPDTLPSPNHLGVAVLSSISSCAPQSTFTFTFRVLCITHISYTQIHSLHNQQVLKLSHSHLVSSFIAMAFSSLSSSNASDIECWNHLHRSGPLIAQQSINLDISGGASYPSSWPLLPLISFEAPQSSFNQSMQCFIIQDILQTSSIVLDIIKQYLYLQEELSPSYLHLQEPFNQAMAYQWQKVIIKGHRYKHCSHPPRYIYFFNPHNYVGLPKGILDSQPKVNMCGSSSH